MTSVYPIKYQVIIKTLREARATDHTTQEELGRALGRPQSFIAKVENGERRLGIVEFAHLCRLVSIDPISIISKP